jgi:hypothetical protein
VLRTSAEEDQAPRLAAKLTEDVAAEGLNLEDLELHYNYAEEYKVGATALPPEPRPACPKLQLIVTWNEGTILSPFRSPAEENEPPPQNEPGKPRR